MIGQDAAGTEVSDEELFAAATQDREPELTPQADETPAVEQPEVNRDGHGRFAAKAEPEPQPGTEAKPDEGNEPAHVPSHRLREATERARIAEARAERAEADADAQRYRATQQPQPQPVQQPVDQFDRMVTDFDGWRNDMLNPLNAEVLSTREYFSRKDANREHGPEKVNEAYAALEKALDTGAMNRAAVVAHLNKSMDPFADIMTWHSEQTLRGEIGNDPKAYEQKIIERYLASQGQGQQQQVGQAQAAPTNVVKLPPSLNRTTSAASNAPSGGDDGLSDAALFNSTTARR